MYLGTRRWSGIGLKADPLARHSQIVRRSAWRVTFACAKSRQRRERTSARRRGRSVRGIPPRRGASSVPVVPARVLVGSAVVVAVAGVGVAAERLSRVRTAVSGLALTA